VKKTNSLFSLNLKFSFIKGNDVNELDAPFTCVRSFVSLYSMLICSRNSSSIFSFFCFQPNALFQLISGKYLIWLTSFVCLTTVKSVVIYFEFSNLLSAILHRVGIPRSPIFTGIKKFSFCYILISLSTGFTRCYNVFNIALAYKVI